MTVQQVDVNRPPSLVLLGSEPDTRCSPRRSWTRCSGVATPRLGWTNGSIRDAHLTLWLQLRLELLYRAPEIGVSVSKIPNKSLMRDSDIRNPMKRGSASVPILTSVVRAREHRGKAWGRRALLWEPEVFRAIPHAARGGTHPEKMRSFRLTLDHAIRLRSKAVFAWCFEPAEQFGPDVATKLSLSPSFLGEHAWQTAASVRCPRSGSLPEAALETISPCCAGLDHRLSRAEAPDDVCRAGGRLPGSPRSGSSHPSTRQAAGGTRTKRDCSIIVGRLCGPPNVS